MNYWHNMANIYMPIKEKYIKEAKIKYYYLFKRSQNVLGILLRGMDYINRKPVGHPRQPNPEMVLSDVNEKNNKYKYKYIFLTTEDDNIREIFVNKLGDKLKAKK